MACWRRILFVTAAASAAVCLLLSTTATSASPVFYLTIADLLAADPPDGTAVELQCKPVLSTGTDAYGDYCAIGEDDSSETLRAYLSTPVSTLQRINRVTGQVQTLGTARILCVDSGPGYDPQGYIGGLQTAGRGTIAWAKTFADGTQLPAPLERKVVSRTFPGLACLYIQEPDGTAGIRVNNEQAVLSLKPGDVVSITTGQVVTTDGERAVNAGAVVLESPTAALAPVGMSTRWLGGGDFNVYTPGPVGGIGLSNVGLLVRVWGRVTSVGPGYFYLDDGTGTSGGSGPGGVRVTEIYGFMPQQNDYAAVNGVLGLTTESGAREPILRLGLNSEITAGTTSDITPLTAMPRPLNPAAVSTGGGKVSVYWDGAQGAAGYNVYRGTSPGGEDYAHPVNGSTLITAPTYSGGSVYMFTDAYLTDGRDYFYTVKAVGPLGLSSPSEEVSEVPSPYALPWDSGDAAAITSAVQSWFYPNFDYIRAVGPDGRIYDSQPAGARLPDGAVVPGTSLIQFTAGETVSAPNDAGENSPYRRVLSTPGYAGGLGVFYLPDTLSVLLAPARSDTPCVYLGSRNEDASIETSAGVRWHRTLSNWEAFQLSGIRCGLNDTRWLLNYAGRGDGNFAAGTSVLMQHLILDGKAASILTVSGVNSLSQFQSICLVNACPAKAAAAGIRRVHSMAQGYPRTYKQTGSYVRSGEAHDVQLLDTAYDTLPWTAAATAEEGSFPSPPTVSWHVITPYTEEDQISIGP